MPVPIYTFSRTRLYGNKLKHPVYNSVKTKTQPVPAHQVIMELYPELSPEEAGKVIHLSEQARDWNSIGHYEMPQPFEDIRTNDLNILRQGWKYLGVTTQDECLFFHPVLGRFAMDMMSAIPLLSMGNLEEIPLQFVADENTGKARLATEAQIQQYEAPLRANPKRYISSLTENDIGYTFLLNNQIQFVYAGVTDSAYILITASGLSRVPRELSHYRDDVMPLENTVYQLNEPVSIVPLLHVPYTKNTYLTHQYDVPSLINLIDNVIPIMESLEKVYKTRSLSIEFKLEFPNQDFQQVQFKLDKRGTQFSVRQQLSNRTYHVTTSSLEQATEQECLDWLNQQPIIQELRQSENFSVSEFHAWLAN